MAGAGRGQRDAQRAAGERRAAAEAAGEAAAKRGEAPPAGRGGVREPLRSRPRSAASRSLLTDTGDSATPCWGLRRARHAPRGEQYTHPGQPPSSSGSAPGTLGCRPEGWGDAPGSPPPSLDPLPARSGGSPQCLAPPRGLLPSAQPRPPQPSPARLSPSRAPSSPRSLSALPREWFPSHLPPLSRPLKASQKPSGLASRQLSALLSAPLCSPHRHTCGKKGALKIKLCLFLSPEHRCVTFPVFHRSDFTPSWLRPHPSPFSGSQAGGTWLFSRAAGTNPVNEGDRMINYKYFGV